MSFNEWAADFTQRLGLPPTARDAWNEAEALRKDAERYRKLRDKGAAMGLRGIFNLMPGEWDEAIDAAEPDDPAVGAA